MSNTIHIDSSGVRSFLPVQKAVSMANDLLQNIEFYNNIAKHPGFYLADISPETIAGLMRKTNIRMYITLYHSVSPVKNYDGYDDIENPSIIHLNMWKIDRSPASICNTIIHSCVHAVNAHHSQHYFGHGDTSLHSKENTAPYWIGALAQRMSSTEDAIIIPLEHDHYEPRIKKMRLSAIGNMG